MYITPHSSSTLFPINTIPHLSFLHAYNSSSVVIFALISLLFSLIATTHSYLLYFLSLPFFISFCLSYLLQCKQHTLRCRHNTRDMFRHTWLLQWSLEQTEPEQTNPAIVGKKKERAQCFVQYLFHNRSARTVFSPAGVTGSRQEYILLKH